MELQVVEYQNVRVVTTKQIADVYNVTQKVISNNFNRNKDKFTEGKHYIRLQGKEKNDFINRPQFDDSLNRAKYIYLWTERGALLLAKSINTDRAWDAYERLVDFYFQKKEGQNFINNSEKQSYIPKVPLVSDWYERNKGRMERLCAKCGKNRKYMYHCILQRLSEKYDLDQAREIYKSEVGYYPIYAIDIVCYFPELGEEADKYLDRIEKAVYNL